MSERREQIARALCDAAYSAQAWDEFGASGQDFYRKLADAVLALPLFSESAARIAELERALGTMNAVTDHQTDRVFPPQNIGGVSIPMRVHPLTCGNDSSHTPLFPYWTGKGVFLRCRDCDYEQRNCAGLDNFIRRPTPTAGES